jgi:hypothetical protein
MFATEMVSALHLVSTAQAARWVANAYAVMVSGMAQAASKIHSVGASFAQHHLSCVVWWHPRLLPEARRPLVLLIAR